MHFRTAGDLDAERTHASTDSNFQKFPRLVQVCNEFEATNESFTMVLVKLSPETVHTISL